MILRLHELKTYIYEELVTHLPFTLVGVAAGVAFVVLSMTLAPWPRFGEEQFHWAHILHIFFSGAAGAAIFKSYRDSLIKAIPVSVASAVILCTVSDILIPVAGLKLAGYEAQLHVCALEHPLRVVLSAFLGVGAGLMGVRFFAHCNRAFHLVHLLISTAASTLYLMNMLEVLDARVVGVIALTLFGALVIPCLTGDVIVPLLFVRMKAPYLHEHVHHSDKPHSHDSHSH